MLTAKNVVEAKSEARAFATKCEQYRALLTENELPLSVSFTELVGVLRAQLFAKLLAVDAGLKMRFEMLRTEEAQQSLIAATIDLNGYDIIDELQRHIKQLHTDFSRLSFRQGPFIVHPEREGKTLGWLCTVFSLDVNRWLESERISWAGKEHVLTYFTEIAEHLTQLRAVHRATRDASAGLQHVVGPWLAGYFTDASNTGVIEPDEYRLMSDLIPKLQQQGKLAGFPGNLK